MGKWTNIPWDDAMRTAVRRGLEGAGVIIESQAAALCPVGQYPGTGRVGGRLRGSITWAVQGARSRVSGPVAKSGDEVSQPSDEYILHVGTNVEYAPYVEYGTRRWPTGQPYLRPAMDLKRQEVAQYFADQISKELHRRE